MTILSYKLSNKIYILYKLYKLFFISNFSHNKKYKRRWYIIGNLLKPTTDYVFKRIFGYSGNEKITANLLHSILNEDIKNINLDLNTFLEKDVIDDKIGILDVKVQTTSGTDIDIEMQVVDQDNIVKRLLFYWSKMYCKNIKSGQDYDSLKRCIVILITDFELNILKDIPKYITKWVIKEKSYGKHMLTDLMEICIIELPIASKYKENNDLDIWAKFIKNPEVINMSEIKNSAIQDAKKVLEDISKDEKERYLAELREKHILDQKAIYSGGYKKGIEQGIAQGIEQTKIEIAKQMLANNCDINLIIKVTNLSKEEIEKL